MMMSDRDGCIFFFGIPFNRNILREIKLYDITQAGGTRNFLPRNDDVCNVHNTVLVDVFVVMVRYRVIPRSIDFQQIMHFLFH